MNLRAKDACRWDLVALGEVMLRLDPGDRRIATTRTFEVCGDYAAIELLTAEAVALAAEATP